jgi:hypothetical protein
MVRTRYFGPYEGGLLLYDLLCYSRGLLNILARVPSAFYGLWLFAEAIIREMRHFVTVSIHRSYQIIE